MIGFFRRYFGLRISNCFKCGKFGYFWRECCIYVRWKMEGGVGDDCFLFYCGVC